ncbi:hypothetical protein J3R30DRAFT_1347524 [Lentinula aciculospora]|uniref:Uncharacterized protein n=1 Tax=Lentinula aciculospora TaxID=153920 RepID=A0A9W9AL37_9AGAR|nr:hypothetical protein J3R30DRAFT_1347524 [Lentinula aciculospora]
MTSTLPSIAEWADKRTAAVYTAKSKTLAKVAIEELFAPHVKASINGRNITREEIDQLLLGMRPTEEGALGFYWTDLVGAPKDPSQRVGGNGGSMACFTYRMQDGSVSGMFIISGLRLPNPQTGELVPMFRRKGVAVIVESQSQDPAVDSRKIVEFVAVANNYPLDQLAAQEKERGTYVSNHLAQQCRMKGCTRKGDQDLGLERPGTRAG